MKKREEPAKFVQERFSPRKVQINEIGKGLPGVEKRQYQKFYCPLCGVEHRLKQRIEPGSSMHWIQLGLTSAVVTLILWPWLEWKGIVSFVPLWAAFEFFYRTRVRDQLRCDQCGFDPMTYLIDVKKARAQVEEFWRARFEEKGIPYPGSEKSEKKEPLAQSADQNSP